MSLSTNRMAAALVVVWASSTTLAHAQRMDDGSDRFFSAKLEKSNEEQNDTLFQGSLTSTTFLQSEFGDDPIGPIDNYSPAQRLYTDLRAQLDAKHMSGSTWDMHMDARVRLNRACTYNSPQDPDTNNQDAVEQNCRSQSGTFGDNEYYARELYAKRTGQKTDLYVGRQYVQEMAATRLDGVKFEYRQSRRWSLLGFGGLSPSRISRSIVDDYPKELIAEDNEGGAILPIAAGFGSAYRLTNVYGSMGLAGIQPLADDRDTNGLEATRVFLTETGYWRPSNILDVYHYLVVDLQGAAGQGLTNASVGISYQPVPAMRVSAAVNRVDTETLNSIAQTEILEVADNGTTTPYNYQRVLRAASNWARVGVSVSLAEQRFEVSTSAQVKQREDLMLESPAGGNDVEIPGTMSAEFLFSVVDRRSIAGLRLGASFIGIVPLGDDSPNRSNTKIARVHSSRMFADDKGEFEFNVSFLSGEDNRQGQVCGLDALDCYGQSSTTTISAGGTAYYRLARDWFGIANAGLGMQSLTDSAGNQVSNNILNGFVRLAYRF